MTILPKHNTLDIEIPIVSGFCVIKRVLAPALAAPAQASAPACPPPITTTSKSFLFGILSNVVEKERMLVVIFHFVDVPA